MIPGHVVGIEARKLTRSAVTRVATATALEAVLRYLPELQAAGIAVDLPNVATLAARKGNSKAVTIARRIVGLQGS